MNLTTWCQIDQLLDEALEVPEEELNAFLLDRCGGDPALQRRIEELRGAEIASRGFLETPIDLTQWISGDDPKGAGGELGPYRLEKRLGGGGMAEVFEAVRVDQSYQRRVAIKRMRSGLLGQDLRLRFQRERQILASLEHSGIARLYDGGTDEVGRPFLVMELVDGARIDSYCDDRKLPLGERLQLFLQLCAAVQFAHQNLLVHRDLKPSNVLVTERGEVKLIDFGIAKQLATADELTRTRPAPLSLAYASPEQVRGEEVSTASDVFSLGILFHELLSGCRPYSLDRPPLLHELARAVCEEVPPLMSEALGRSADVEAIARRRSSRPRDLRRQLSGDLDSIVAKALEKDPSRRYPSVEALVADLSRYLQQLPVVARHRGAFYRAGKFLRRHRITGAVAAVFAVLLGLFVSTQIEQARRMARERDKVTRAMDFMVDLFAVSRPGDPLGEAVPARQLLDRAARRATLELRGEPEVQATLLDTLGQVYRNLGLVATAEDLLRSALEIRRRGSGHDPELARTLHNLAVTVGLRSGDQEALLLFDEALNLRQKHFGEVHPQVAETQRAKASWLALTQRYQEAEALARKAVASYGAHPDQGLELAAAREQLSMILQRVGKGEEARRLVEQALAARRRIYGNDHPLIAAGLEILGESMRGEGRLEEAVALQRQSLEMRRRISAPTDTDLLLALHSLALALKDLGRLSEAEGLLREEMEQLEVMFPGADHMGKGAALFNLSRIFAERGEHTEALKLARRDLEMRRRLFGDEHPQTAPSWLNVGSQLRRSGKHTEAEAVLRRALELFAATRPPGHPGRPVPKVELGAVLSAQGRFEEGESLLREALAELSAVLPAGHPRVAAACLHLGSCLRAQGLFDEAEPLLLAGLEALRARGDGAPGLAWARREVATFYRTSGRPRPASTHADATGSPRP